jgi:hypothetical protein
MDKKKKIRATILKEKISKEGKHKGKGKGAGHN